MTARLTLAPLLLALACTPGTGASTSHPFLSHAARAVVKCATPVANDAISNSGAPGRASLIGAGVCLLGRLLSGPESARVRSDAELAELGQAGAAARVAVLDAREGRGSEADALAAVAECEKLAAQ